jgi:HAD superfamily hydrolase (TIGR01509 family)
VDCGGIADIDDTVRDCTGVNLTDTAVYWQKKYPHISFETFLAHRGRHFNAIIADGVPVKEGAFDVLAYLREQGYKVAMATSTPYATVMEHLADTGMTDCFDVIVTGDMVKRGKPDPEIYLMAAERLGVDPAACVGVEDSPNGVRSIHAAGMRAIMIPDMVEPTEEIRALLWKECRDLSELIPLLSQH